MKGEGMDKVREALPELPASQAFSLTRSIYTADDMHAYASAALASRDAELAKLRQGVPVAWERTEGWEALAWQLCAEENGEEACNELVWEGGPIPEPWGDRWLKYEGEAKRMIALVGKHASPPPAPVQPEPVLAQPKREPLTDDDITRLAESEGWHIWHEDVLREALSFGHAVVRLTLGEQG